MWQKRQQKPLLAATLFGICSMLASIQPTLSSSTSNLPPPHQPPTATQNVTMPMEEEVRVRVLRLENDDEALSDRAKELNKQAAGDTGQLEVIEDLNYGSEVEEELEEDSAADTTTTTAITEKPEEFVGVPGFLPTVLPPSTPTNGHGYIQFEMKRELPVEAVRRRRPIEQTVTQSRTETVNEVLSNLFPNGFSDIFRFSGRDPGTGTDTEPATTTTAPTANTATDKAVVRPTVDATAITTEATVPVAVTEPAREEDSPRNETYFSYQTTVTKEYRRELRPGHTEIVVEKITRSEPSSGDGHPFRDGSNHISRDELLRINRAAVAAPVLPSLLLLPESDDNETLVAAESAPIVILGEHETELDEGQDFEDNQIAESRHAARSYYQQRLPPPAPNSIESYANRKGPGQEQEINVHIVHDDTLAKAQEGAEKLEQQSLDHYQVRGEQSAQEAPSRQFLKSFKPVISGSGDGPIAKGTFHYEASQPPQLPLSRPPQEADYANPFVRPAAPLSYQQELSHGIPQSSQPPQQQQQQYQQELHTQAIPSPAQSPPEVQQHYSDYAGPTPNSLVFVTLNTPPPPQVASSPAPAHASAQEAAVQITVHHPAPHEYEAAAEPSQQHIQHAPHPSAAYERQPESQPNGYTFVEVQKSVNIHNKLITEKDGRLVEQHETIYHQPYPQNHISQPSPAAATGKSYPSLTTNPINVEQAEHESSPPEVAVSHAAISLETRPQETPRDIHAEHVQPPNYHPPQHYHQQQTVPQAVAVVEKVVPQPYVVEKHVDRPVKQFVEKHIPVPYAVHQPVPVPVHVEHYVDRPYPVTTYVEHPVPYPVETVVEKIVEKHVPVEVERIVERPVEVEKIVEKFVDRPMAIPIHVPVAIHMPMPPPHSALHSFGHHPNPNALHPWSHTVAAHIPPKVLQNYYTRMLKKLLPQITQSQSKTTQSKAAKTPVKSPVKPPVKPVRGEAPPVATFSLADMRFDLRPPPPPQGSAWLQGARYIYNTLPADLATAAASAPAQMVKSYIGPVPGSAASASDGSTGNEFDEFQRWRNGHSLKRSPDFGRNLQLEYGFKPPLVPSMEIDDKGNPLKQQEPETL
ncbi:uncharacterized protein LOC117892644 [Drosophila subobscura]|uniref:uncharacterized protein LOC117892644 n=1 Tax=Drosophila subobscura TaxID=7241 RepID=UPI00155ABF4B|nr:uncharacterized protein LOC117892644 [Drosophila subobscura]